jgi:hypothetical protein
MVEFEENLKRVGEGIIQVVQGLEGEYKFYALAIVASVITGLVTRFIFKTIKWFILLVALGGLALALFTVVRDLA